MGTERSSHLVFLSATMFEAEKAYREARRIEAETTSETIGNLAAGVVGGVLTGWAMKTAGFSKAASNLGGIGAGYLIYKSKQS